MIKSISTNDLQKLSLLLQLVSHLIKYLIKYLILILLNLKNSFSKNLKLKIIFKTSHFVSRIFSSQPFTSQSKLFFYFFLKTSRKNDVTFYSLSLIHYFIFLDLFSGD